LRFSPFSDDTSSSRKLSFEKIRARIEGTQSAAREDPRLMHLAKPVEPAELVRTVAVATKSCMPVSGR